MRNRPLSAIFDASNRDNLDELGAEIRELRHWIWRAWEWLGDGACPDERSRDDALRLLSNAIVSTFEITKAIEAPTCH
jgi:hypothetical protein